MPHVLPSACSRAERQQELLTSRGQDTEWRFQVLQFPSETNPRNLQPPPRFSEALLPSSIAQLSSNPSPRGPFRTFKGSTVASSLLLPPPGAGQGLHSTRVPLDFTWWLWLCTHQSNTAAAKLFPGQASPSSASLAGTQLWGQHPWPVPGSTEVSAQHVLVLWVHLSVSPVLEKINLPCDLIYFTALRRDISLRHHFAILGVLIMLK